MSVKIRMKRFGRKNRPYYRIVAIDTRNPRDGATIENLGTYHPLEKEDAKVLTLEEERVRYWLSVGAQPSETIASILKGRGIPIPWLVNRAEKKKTAIAARREKKGPKAKKAAAPAVKKTPAQAATAAAAAAEAKASKKAKREADRAK